MKTLLQRAQQGDPQATAELFTRYWRAARAAAYGVTGNWAAAEDAAAEGFTQALGSLASLQDPDRFPAWLRTIVVRKARAARPRPSELLEDQLPAQAEHPDEALYRRELSALLQHAVSQLPPPLRETIALHYFEGYAPAEAAQFLDILPGTFRRRLHHGRRQLRTLIEQRNPAMSPTQQQLEKWKAQIASGDIYPAMRESLALRPVPAELMNLFRGHLPSPPVDQAAAWLFAPEPAETAVTAAIRQALPQFTPWQLPPDAPATYFAPGSDDTQRLRALLPPGFAEGRPGSFIRATRGLVHITESGQMQSVYELMQATPNPEAFQSLSHQLQLSPVLDLNWMVVGPLELHTVQLAIEQLCAAVFPNKTPHFTRYDGPRYRAAFQLQIDGHPTRLALGGVMSEWPGRPREVDAAHVRIFLEPCAEIYKPK